MDGQGQGAGSRPVAQDAVGLPEGHIGSTDPADRNLKHSWACRSLAPLSTWRFADRSSSSKPRVGDVVVAEIVKTGKHQRVMTASNKRLRMYPGDKILGALGNRYATMAFEARVSSLHKLHMLTGAGMLGTVRSRHSEQRAPTELRYLGHLLDESGKPVNLKDRLFPTETTELAPCRTLLVVGTAMDTGKTTAVARLARGLARRGKRVAACKLTGSVSHRDPDELLATGVVDVRDFSDYGLPSTYLCPQDELVRLYTRMLEDAARCEPEIVLMELADGLLQRETSMLLSEPGLRRRAAGVLLTAPCAASALYAVAAVEQLGHRVVGVSGVITNSPLLVAEFGGRSSVPVASSAGSGDALTDLVLERLRMAV
ncbi:MAG: hypothetical protein MJD61_11565 [Proteobacteria bacterium]|nr:hypothetical protein [Pseudomonadota bacterium]